MTIHAVALQISSLLTMLAMANPAWASPQDKKAPKDKKIIPDFTQGAKIPADAKHDWNLGPTGLRGWIYCDKLVTTDARQIFITQVEQGSPALGQFRANDVILGVGGKPFSFDPRTELGRAITAAESESGNGKLTLTRWRSGETQEITLQLPVLGNYSATAPNDCPKSKRLLEDGCKALAARMAMPAYTDQDPIPRSLNALALLASGNPEYLPLVKKEAQWAAAYSSKSMQTWHYGYCMMLLAEYVIATGDQSVVPGLRRLALEAAKGQSAVGSWGHGFAIPDGRLGGYGMMNSPGIPLTIALVMAREAGVIDPEVARAIELSARLLRFYIGKGAIPYGDHHPWTETHDDNGKCGMATVLFDLLGETKGAEFFSRMSVASHSAERDCGHTGNYFNLLWALPGVARSGPHATGAWMNEFGTWYFDLARQHDGSYRHQGPPENEEDSFAGWDSTGTHLLAYAMPLKKIYLTGKRHSVVPQLDAAASQALIVDGRGWNNKDRTSAYDKLTLDQLMAHLGSWSPVVRERAAMALARRKELPIPTLIKMLQSPSLEARYGACQLLIALRSKGAPAVEPLRQLLTEKDLWLRIKAAEALAQIGKPAMAAVPQLLELLAKTDQQNDPRGMQQRYLAFALFDGQDNSMISKSLDTVDREALYAAVRAGLKNQDGRARGSIGSVYRNLSAKEIMPLLPAIHQAINEPAPSGEMFADTIRVEGLRLFAKHHIEEGMVACVQYTRNQNPWDSQVRTPELMKILFAYGTHAKSMIPQLEKIANYFEKEEPNFPKNLMRVKAKCVREAIRTIEAATDTPELLHLKAGGNANLPAPASSAKAPGKPSTKPLKVFVLAGQSNMQGHASVSTFDSLATDTKTAPLLAEMRGPDGKPKVCDAVWISSIGCLGDAYSDLREKKGQLTAGFGAPDNKIGPEFTFGLYMSKALNEPILIIKTAWGGRSLNTDFRSPSAGPKVFNDYTRNQWKKSGLDADQEAAKNNKNDGIFYHHMIDHVQKVLKDIKRVVPDYDPKQGYELAGFVWFQGFNDLVDSWTYPDQGKPGGYDQYAELLAHFIRDVRKDLAAPKLPFVIGVMGIGGIAEGKKGEQMHFRQAQAAPAALAEFKGNVKVVETAPFWDDDLEALQQRMEKCNNKFESEAKKGPKQTREEKDAAKKKAIDQAFTAAELKRFQTGVSNGGYHYLGAAKILAPIGKAFAEALLPTDPKPAQSR